MTYFVRDEFPQANGERLLLLSLTHDLGEIFTGDIPAFVKTDTDRNLSLIHIWESRRALRPARFSSI